MCEVLDAVDRQSTVLVMRRNSRDSAIVALISCSLDASISVAASIPAPDQGPGYLEADPRHADKLLIVPQAVLAQRINLHLRTLCALLHRL